MRNAILYKDYVIQWIKNSGPEIASDLTQHNREIKWTGLNRVRPITFQNFNSFRILRKSISFIAIVCSLSKYPKSLASNGKVKQMLYSILFSIARIFLWIYSIYGSNCIQLSTLYIKILWQSKLRPSSTIILSKSLYQEWKAYTRKMLWRIQINLNWK